MKQAEDSARYGLKNHVGKQRLLSLEDLDGRTYAAKTANLLRAELEADLGGVDNISTAQRELIKRAALLGAILGDIEANWLIGEKADLSLFGSLIDRQRRLLETLGLRRVPRNVTPSLHDYLDGEAAE